MSSSKEYYSKAEYDEIIKKALHRGYQGDIYGANLWLLGGERYDYIGNGNSCNTWYMVIIDEYIDEDYHRTDKPVQKETDMDRYRATHPILDKDGKVKEIKGRVCHFLASKSLTEKPPKGVKGRSARIDPHYPGANIYILPQIMKRQYVPNKEYFTMPEEDRYKYRTRKTSYQNNYIRSGIFGEMKRQKAMGKLSPEMKADFMRQIDATRVGDIAHPPVGHVGYTKDDILAYVTIVMDIDNHVLPPEWVEHLCDEYAKILVRGCDDNGEVISDVLPHRVVKTGRGLQLWFDIEPVYYPAAFLVEKAAEALCDEYEKITEKYFPDLEVDREATTNIGGFKRLPGSYNSKAPSKDKFGEWRYKTTQQKSKVVKQDDDWLIYDLLEALGVKISRPTEKSGEAKAKKKKQYHGGKGHNVRAQKLMKLFEDLAPEMEDHDGRNCLAFKAGTVALENGTDVLEYLYGLNRKFAESMSDGEVDKIVGSVRKGIYHYSTARIAADLGLTDEMLKKYGLSTESSGMWISNEDRAAERKKKRDKRDDDIKSHLRAGETISAIARAVGVCRATVKKVKAEAEEAKRKADIHRQLISERNKKNRDSFAGIVRRAATIVTAAIKDDTRSRAADVPMTNLTS